jgi:Spy/CpxP family protein refolding chaperone
MLKNVWKISLLVVLLSLFVKADAFPQGTPPPDIKQQERMREKIETTRTWKLIDYLDLSEEQSEKFLPALKKLREKEKELFEKKRELFERLNFLIEEEKSNPDKIKETLLRLEENRKKMQEERELFLLKAKDVLTLTQQAKLVLFEEKFEQRMKEIINEVKERRKGKGF